MKSVKYEGVWSVGEQIPIRIRERTVYPVRSRVWDRNWTSVSDQVVARVLARIWGRFDT